MYPFFFCLSLQRPPEKCRYVVGSVLSEGGETPDEEVQKLYEKFGFKVFSLPEVSHAVTTTFPCTTPLSYVLGTHRVYPRLASYIEVQTIWEGDKSVIAGVCPHFSVTSYHQESSLVPSGKPLFIFFGLDLKCGDLNSVCVCSVRRMCLLLSWMFPSMIIATTC